VQTRNDVEQLNQASDETGPDVLTKLSDRELLERALEALDDRYKEPFLLVFQEDFTCREAADLLDIPLGTVLSRIYRARQFMRRFLRQLDPTDEPEVVAPHTPYKRNGEP